MNSSQIDSSKFEIWYREGPQKLKKKSTHNSVNFKQKIQLRVVFPLEKYVEFGHQIEFYRAIVLIIKHHMEKNISKI